MLGPDGHRPGRPPLADTAQARHHHVSQDRLDGVPGEQPVEHRLGTRFVKGNQARGESGRRAGQAPRRTGDGGLRIRPGRGIRARAAGWPRTPARRALCTRTGSPLGSRAEGALLVQGGASRLRGGQAGRQVGLHPPDPVLVSRGVQALAAGGADGLQHPVPALPDAQQVLADADAAAQLAYPRSARPRLVRHDTSLDS
jgi:hypothetical protein